MRNMSFAMTPHQIEAETKTVTRRFGWWFLTPGDYVQAVEKSMGLKKGEKIKPLKTIKIISTRKEPLNAITKEDVIREGFPDWTPKQFIDLLVNHYRIDPAMECNRIEFQYIQQEKQLKLL